MSDPHTEYTLVDVFNDDVPRNEYATEYRGLHLRRITDNTYSVQADGHMGVVEEIDVTEHDGVMDLVDACNWIAHTVWVEGDQEWRVDNCGPILTSDPDKRDHEHYQYVPREPELDEQQAES